MTYKSESQFSIDQVLRAFRFALSHRPNSGPNTWRRDNVPIVELQALKICHAELGKWLSEQQ